MCHVISNVLNQILEKSNNGIELGTRNRFTLPKLKKTQGPVKNLLPVTLLEIMNLRKSQNTYRKCRSVSNIVQPHQQMVAKRQGSTCPAHSRQYI